MNIIGIWKIGSITTSIIAFMFFVSSDAVNATVCLIARLPQLLNGQYILSKDNMSALYFCNEDYHFSTLPSSSSSKTIVYCDSQGNWQGKPAECVKTSCKPNPCQNGGKCSTAEDPFKTGYTCICPDNYGGRRCQVANPCSTCPSGTRCMITFANDMGRFCHDTNGRLVT